MCTGTNLIYIHANATLTQIKCIHRLTLVSSTPKLTPQGLFPVFASLPPLAASHFSALTSASFHSGHTGKRNLFCSTGPSDKLTPMDKTLEDNKPTIYMKNDPISNMGSEYLRSPTFQEIACYLNRCCETLLKAFLSSKDSKLQSMYLSAQK